MMPQTLEARGRVVEVRDGIAEVRLPVAVELPELPGTGVCGSGREQSVHVAAASGLAVGDVVSLRSAKRVSRSGRRSAICCRR
jgi:hypothetical protein